MKLMAENAISSFFYYMWNAWGETECKIVFGGMHKHFWGKWNALADKAISVQRNDSMQNYRTTTVRCW